MTIKTLARIGLVAAFAATAPIAAQAQDRPSSFDGARVVAVAAGVAVGTVVAGLLTDGLILPVLAWVPGVGSGAATATVAAAPGAAPAAAPVVVVSQGYGVFGWTMRLLGAVGGGMWADSLYLGRRS